MKIIIIRTLGGQGIGYGHFYRCIALANAIMMNNSNYISIIFIVNEELEKLMETTEYEFFISDNLDEDLNIIDLLKVNLFIFDSYLGNDKYLLNIKEKTKLMLIDDNNDIYDLSIPDILYNGNIHAEKLRYMEVEGQLRLLGTRYLIMKEEYWNNDMDKKLKKDGILVTTGGTDEYEIALSILKELINLDFNIKLIIGPGFKYDYIRKIERMKTNNVELIYKPSSLKPYIKSSQVVITASGSTVYEVLSQRIVPITFSMANNQDLICKELRDLGILYLGKYPNIEFSQLKDYLGPLQKDYKFDKRIFDMIDGKGAKIVAEKILQIVQ